MPVNYHQVIRESREELKQCLIRREQTDKRIAELTIALRGLVGFVPDEAERKKVLQEVRDARRKPPSLNEAISNLLERSKDRLTSSQIREQLELSGFDIEEYSQPLGAVMTALQRLVEAGKVKRDLTPEKTVVFSWASILNAGDLKRRAREIMEGSK